MKKELDDSQQGARDLGNVQAINSIYKKKLEAYKEMKSELDEVILSRESMEEELDELRTRFKKDERLMEFKEELK